MNLFNLFFEIITWVFTIGVIAIVVFIAYKVIKLCCNADKKPRRDDNSFDKNDK